MAEDLKLLLTIKADSKQAQKELQEFRRNFAAQFGQFQKTGSDSYKKFEHDASGAIRGVERTSKQSFAQIEQGAQRSASSMARSFLGGAAQIATGFLGGNLLLGALSKVGDALKSQITSAFDFKDLEERTLIAFSTMFRNAGLSAEDAAAKAKKQWADVVEFGARTPFKTPQLAELTQQLMAVGFEAEEVIPTLRSIGDAVAGLGGNPEKLQRIIAQLGQMKTTGQVSGEEIRTLAEAGIPAWRYLAEYAGKSVAQVRKLAKNNQLDADVAVKVIVAGMGRDFEGLMKATEGTYSSMWSTIEDLNQQRAAEAFAPAFEQVKRGQRAAIAGLSSTAAQEFTKGAAEIQNSVIGSFDSILSALATGDFKALGAGAVESVVTGATGAAKNLYGAGKDAGAQLEQGYRDRLEQHSPSKVMERLGFDAGLSLAQGFQQGIAKGDWKGDIEKTIKELADYFERMTGDKLPVKVGQTKTHAKLGYDHRAAADIQIGPSDPRFVFIEQFLNNRGVPFRASPGPERNAAGRVISTGEHTHVGNLSRNLQSPAPARAARLADPTSREVATLEAEYKAKTAEMLGHLEALFLERQEMQRWVTSLTKQINQSPLSAAADPELVTKRDDFERQLSANAGEAVKYRLAMLDELKAIQDKIAAAREQLQARSPSPTAEPFVVSEAADTSAVDGGSFRPGAELPAPSQPLMDALTLINLEAPKAGMGLMSVKEHQFELLKVLSDTAPIAEETYARAGAAAGSFGSLITVQKEELIGFKDVLSQMHEELEASTDFSAAELASATLGQAFLNLKANMLGSIDAIIFGGKSLKKALADAFKDTLAQTAAFLGKKAMLKGMEEVAEALSSLAVWDLAGFARHSAAAAGWFALSAAAAVGGRMIMGGGGASAGGGEGEGAGANDASTYESERTRREREQAEADRYTRREFRGGPMEPQVIHHVVTQRVHLTGVDDVIARQMEQALNNDPGVRDGVARAWVSDYRMAGTTRETVRSDY